MSITPVPTLMLTTSAIVLPLDACFTLVFRFGDALRPRDQLRRELAGIRDGRLQRISGERLEIKLRALGLAQESRVVQCLHEGAPELLDPLGRETRRRNHGAPDGEI